MSEWSISVQHSLLASQSPINAHTNSSPQLNESLKISSLLTRNRTRKIVRSEHSHLETLR